MKIHRVCRSATVDYIFTDNSFRAFEGYPLSLATKDTYHIAVLNPSILLWIHRMKHSRASLINIINMDAHTFTGNLSMIPLEPYAKI